MSRLQYDQGRAGELGSLVPETLGRMLGEEALHDLLVAGNHARSVRRPGCPAVDARAVSPTLGGYRPGECAPGKGAIDSVHVLDGGFDCHVIGGGPARGICGSGLVDAAACGVELGLIGAKAG
jgi:hypothetical protein